MVSGVNVCKRVASSRRWVLHAGIWPESVCLVPYWGLRCSWTVRTRLHQCLGDVFCCLWYVMRHEHDGTAIISNRGFIRRSERVTHSGIWASRSFYLKLYCWCRRSKEPRRRNDPQSDTTGDITWFRPLDTMNQSVLRQSSPDLCVLDWLTIIVLSNKKKKKKKKKKRRREKQTSRIMKSQLARWNCWNWR